ncbi:Ribonucleases P/MRP protein subunit pop1 [Sphaceloma murrayae]|uniref:Ribonucleases P/MRP protein subunit pop1 n=1 Tax=Sphaceloma murrayae TaxID=2082308 RepID=A0A2K1QHZ4_9PEZI|nr:Ribonucleases P/MRP protein subunit pop1 [Sphaceloma murrayae]
MASPQKPGNPPQKAGQKRKSDAADSSSAAKKPKPNQHDPVRSGRTVDQPKNKQQQQQQQQKQASHQKQNQKQNGPPQKQHPSGQNPRSNPQHLSSKNRPTKSSNGPSSARNRRTTARLDARTLATQTTSKAFTSGALDVASFVKAREFEIRALQEGLQRHKKARMERAFQSVPREMRRRAGAWDVRRLPKGRARREKARREVREDNTPTGRERRGKVSREARLRGETVRRLRALGAKRKGEKVVGVLPEKVETRAAKARKNRLKDPPVPKARFRKRQINKTWLPTHMYHAKRAHMSPALEPIWRFALPLTPTAKSYRPTHRAVSERGAIAWDVSYTSTVGLEGVEKSLLNLLRGLGIEETALTGNKGRLWRIGRRVWQGWAFARDTKSQDAIACVTAIWQEQDQRNASDDTPEKRRAYPRRKLLLRVHPSAFHQLWEEVIRLCKVQKPEVKAEDLRFEIGSIEITGPGSTEALQGALWPSSTADKDPSAALWKSLCGLDNPGSLPANASLAFKISDPRLHHPPRTIESSTDLTTLLSTLATFNDNLPACPQALFDSRTCRASITAMQSQKAINRRFSTSDPGTYPPSLPTDPSIPALLYSSSVATSAHALSQKLASWSVLLPWKAVPAVWQSLMYYPLSSGGQVRFGGQKEQRQLAFERCVPWFPGDYPGTQAGDLWVNRETEGRKKEWEAKPPSRRVNFDVLELGNGEIGERGHGWAVDWALVLKREVVASEIGSEPVRREVDKAGKVSASEGAGMVADDAAGPEKPAQAAQKTKPWHCTTSLARKLLKAKQVTAEQPDVEMANGTDIPTTQAEPMLLAAEQAVDHALTTVRLVYLGRGTPDPAARIYRLPSNDVALREKWVRLVDETTSKRKKEHKAPPNRLLPKPGSDLGEHNLDLKKLARDLVGLDSVEDGSSQHPPVPKQEDLIGFVTSGGFNLREGKGTAIGSVGLGKLRDTVMGEFVEKLKSVCIVRNAGEVVGRLARWELI